MVHYMGPDFIEKNVKTLPGGKYIVQTLEEMEAELGKKLPENFPVSLWMSTFLVKKDARQELVLPDNPREEASYFLFFRQPDSYRLKRSLLVRITDRPQSFYGILNHPKINKITRELREAYDGRKIKRVKTSLRIPSRDWAWHHSFTAEPHEITVQVVRPNRRTNTAHDFEGVFERHNAVEDMQERGYKNLYDAVQYELLTIETLT